MKGSEKSCSKSSGSVLVNFPQYYLTQKRGNMWFSSSIPWEMVWKHKPTSLHHRVRFTGHQPQHLRRLLSVPSLGQMLRHPKWFVYSEVWKKKYWVKSSGKYLYAGPGKLRLAIRTSVWNPPWSSLGTKELSLHTTKDICLLCIYMQRWKLRRLFFFAFFKIVYISYQKLTGASLDTSSIGLLCGIFASENQDPGTPPPRPEKLNRCHRPAGSSLSDSGLSCVLQRWLLHRNTETVN